MKYKQLNSNQAISLLIGVLLGATLVAFYAHGRIEDSRMRRAKIQITLDRLVNAIEQLEDNNESDLAALKQLAGHVSGSLSSRTSTSDANEANP